MTVLVAATKARALTAVKDGAESPKTRQGRLARVRSASEPHLHV